MPQQFQDWALSVIEALPDQQAEPEARIEPEAFAPDDVGGPVQPLDRIFTGEEELVPVDTEELWSDRNTDSRVAAGPPISDEDLDGSVRGANVRGFDAWAFYKSIHRLEKRPFPGKWGIFVLDTGLETIRALYDQFSESPPAQDSRRLAMRILHAHEFFHFRVDAWSISQEAVLQKALYIPYQDEIYRHIYPGRWCVEESLANRSMVSKLARKRVRPFLDYLIESQPPAYSVSDFSRGDAYAELAAQLIDLAAGGRNPRKDLSPWVARDASSLTTNPTNCPTYVIEGCRPSQYVAPSAGAPPLKEIKPFVKKYLNGSFLRRTDHEYWRIDNGEEVKIPNAHAGTDRLKRGEFINIAGKAGLTQGMYWKAKTSTDTWKRNVPRYPILDARI